MPMPRFFLLTSLGTCIFSICLVLLGALAGASWEKIAGYMGVYSKVGVVVLGITAVIAAAVFYLRRKKKKTAAAKEADGQEQGMDK